MYERIVATSVDARGVLWETWDYVDANGDKIGGGTRAVCRPESCADGHKCGKLDVGIIRDSTPNTPEDLDLFADRWRESLSDPIPMDVIRSVVRGGEPTFCKPIPCPDPVETTISFVTDDPDYSEYVAQKMAGELDD